MANIFKKFVADDFSLFTHLPRTNQQALRRRKPWCKVVLRGLKAHGWHTPRLPPMIDDSADREEIEQLCALFPPPYYDSGSDMPSDLESYVKAFVDVDMCEEQPCHKPSLWLKNVGNFHLPTVLHMANLALKKI